MTDCQAQDGRCLFVISYEGEDCEGCIAIAALEDEDSLDDSDEDDSDEDEDDEEIEDGEENYEEGQLEAEEH